MGYLFETMLVPNTKTYLFLLLIPIIVEANVLTRHRQARQDIDACSSDTDCENNANGKIVCDTGNTDKCIAPPAPVDDCTANADCENNANGLTVCDVGNTDKCIAPPAPVDDCTANADCENNANGLTVCDVGNTDKCIAPPVNVDDCTADTDCENNDNGLTKCDVANSDKCICPNPGEEINPDTGVCECPAGQRPNTDTDACENIPPKKSFFTMVVDIEFDADFNTQGTTKVDVAEDLEGTLCADYADTITCEVEVLEFSQGSTQIKASVNLPEDVTLDDIEKKLNTIQEIEIAGTEGSVTARQTSASNFDRCSEGNQCAVGEGDCDKDADCEGDAVCGINNCANGDPLADCCYIPDPAAPCDGTGLNLWDCCKYKPDGCDEGAGDCDSDSECAENLVCGRNSCTQDFNNNMFSDSNSDRFFPSGQADCCINKARALFYGIPSKRDLEEDWQNQDEP